VRLFPQDARQNGSASVNSHGVVSWGCGHAASSATDPELLYVVPCICMCDPYERLGHVLSREYTSRILCTYVHMYANAECWCYWIFSLDLRSTFPRGNKEDSIRDNAVTLTIFSPRNDFINALGAARAISRATEFVITLIKIIRLYCLFIPHFISLVCSFFLIRYNSVAST